MVDLKVKLLGKKVLCSYCRRTTSVDASDWQKIEVISWCPTCYPELFATLKEGFSREDFHSAYVRLRPSETLRADQLLIGLGLAAPCGCNNCRRR